MNGLWKPPKNFFVIIFVMVKATVAGDPGRKINLYSNTAKQFLNSSIDVPL